MRGIAQDFRFGFRILIRNRGVSAVAILTLALGIGINTSMFSVVNAVLLRSLPYRAPHELVAVWTRYLPPSGYDFPFFSLSGPEALDLRRLTGALSAVAPYRWQSLNLTGEGSEPERVIAVAASSNVFSVLGVEPVLGRTFTEEEDRPGAGCVTVLSHGLWTERWGADSEILGKSLSIDGSPCVVMGVMSESFFFPVRRVRLWIPLQLDPATAGDRGSHSLGAVGRLAKGATIDLARAEVETLMARWAEDHPDHHRGHFVILESFHEDQVRDVRSALLVLMGAVGFVLLIVCSNVANLLLARAESRRREMAVRAALGAGRLRLVRQLLSESLLLAAIGGGLGLLLSAWTLDGLLTLYPRSLPLVGAVPMDARVLAFTAVTALGSVLLFGLAPAFSIATFHVQDALRTEGRTGGGGSRRVTAHRALVVAQIGLSLTLLVGAGLLIRSFARLQRVDLGFDPEGVLTLYLSASAGSQPRPEQVRQLYADILTRVASLPGVESAGLVSSLPLQRGAPPDDFQIEGRPPPAPGATAYNADYVMVTPGFFETLRIPLRRGRLFQIGDVEGAPRVAIVNETAARKYWPGEDPIGQRIRYLADDAPWVTVVGIVGSVRSREPSAGPRPAIYTPYGQASRGPSYDDTGLLRFLSLVVRASGRPEPLAPSVRAILRERDPSLPVSNLMTMTDVVSRAAAQPRFTSLLMSLFAGAALVLAMVGIYGVMSYSVEQARHAIGIRMALGATTADVLRLVIVQGARMAAAGVSFGLAAAVLVTRSMGSLLYEVSPTDPTTFGAIALILALVSLAACYIPARRASRLDPIDALRYE